MILKKVFKHGSSLSFILPKEVCEHLDLRRGDYLYLTSREAGEIVLGKVNLERQPWLVPYIESEKG